MRGVWGVSDIVLRCAHGARRTAADCASRRSRASPSARVRSREAAAAFSSALRVASLAFCASRAISASRPACARAVESKICSSAAAPEVGNPLAATVGPYVSCMRCPCEPGAAVAVAVEEWDEERESVPGRAEPSSRSKALGRGCSLCRCARSFSFSRSFSSTRARAYSADHHATPVPLTSTRETRVGDAATRARTADSSALRRRASAPAASVAWGHDEWLLRADSTHRKHLCARLHASLSAASACERAAAAASSRRLRSSARMAAA